MEEFKFTSLMSNLAHQTFLQGSIGTGKRGEDQVIPLNGWNKFLLIINKMQQPITGAYKPYMLLPILKMKELRRSRLAKVVAV